MKTTIGLNELALRIREVFHMAHVCKWTASELDDRVSRVIWEPLHSKTTSGRRRFSLWMCGYAHGIIDQLHHEIWQHVEFCYRDASGVLFSTWKASTHRKTEEFYAANRGCELANMECAHVWKGTAKPYTPWSVPNKPKLKEED